MAFFWNHFWNGYLNKATWNSNETTYNIQYGTETVLHTLPCEVSILKPIDEITEAQKGQAT